VVGGQGGEGDGRFAAGEADAGVGELVAQLAGVAAERGGEQVRGHGEGAVVGVVDVGADAADFQGGQV
jgi:hypothetical protein